MEIICIINNTLWICLFILLWLDWESLKNDLEGWVHIFSMRWNIQAIKQTLREKIILPFINIFHTSSPAYVITPVDCNQQNSKHYHGKNITYQCLPSKVCYNINLIVA